MTTFGSRRLNIWCVKFKIMAFFITSLMTNVYMRGCHFTLLHDRHHFIKRWRGCALNIKAVKFYLSDVPSKRPCMRVLVVLTLPPFLRVDDWSFNCFDIIAICAFHFSLVIYILSIHIYTALRVIR